MSSDGGGPLLGGGGFFGGAGEDLGPRGRYGADPGSNAQPLLVKLSQMDRPLVFILVFLTSAAIVGLGIAFVGLAYHHARRDREFLWEKERHAAQQRTTV